MVASTVPAEKSCLYILHSLTGVREHLTSVLVFFSWWFCFCICYPFTWLTLAYVCLYQTRHHLSFRIFDYHTRELWSSWNHAPLATSTSSFLCLDTLITFVWKQRKKKSKPSVRLRQTSSPLIPTSHLHGIGCFSLSMTSLGSVFVKNITKEKLIEKN